MREIPMRRQVPQGNPALRLFVILLLGVLRGGAGDKLLFMKRFHKHFHSTLGRSRERYVDVALYILSYALIRNSPR